MGQEKSEERGDIDGCKRVGLEKMTTWSRYIVLKVRI